MLKLRFDRYIRNINYLRKTFLKISLHNYILSINSIFHLTRAWCTIYCCTFSIWLIIASKLSISWTFFVATFVDLDECQSPDACGANHVCNNTVGSYRCECPIGFVADSGELNPLAPVCIGTKSSNLEESSNTEKYTVSFLFCEH